MFPILPAKVYVFKDKAITDKNVLAKLATKKVSRGKGSGAGQARKKKK